MEKQSLLPKVLFVGFNLRFRNFHDSNCKNFDRAWAFPVNTCIGSQSYDFSGREAISKSYNDPSCKGSFYSKSSDILPLPCAKIKSLLNDSFVYGRTYSSSNMSSLSGARFSGHFGFWSALPLLLLL
jgi:hypothetical protein